MIVIGIAGGSGSGKTTVVNKIMERLAGASIAVLSQDAYYNDNAHLTLEQRRQINFDHPDAIEFSLLTEHLKMLKAGQAIEEPIYSFKVSTRMPGSVHIEPADVVIVDGIMVLTVAELREQMDIKVFVDADDDDRLSRRIKRDVVERGRTLEHVLQHYEATVKPMHLQFIEPSKRFADIIIPQGGQNDVAIDVLAHYIEKYLGK